MKQQCLLAMSFSLSMIGGNCETHSMASVKRFCLIIKYNSTISEKRVVVFVRCGVAPFDKGVRVFTLVQCWWLLITFHYAAQNILLTIPISLFSGDDNSALYVVSIDFTMFRALDQPD